MKRIMKTGKTETMRTAGVNPQQFIFRHCPKGNGKPFLKRAHFVLCPFSESHAGSPGKKLKLSEPVYMVSVFLSFRHDFRAPPAKGQPEMKKARALLIFKPYVYDFSVFYSINNYSFFTNNSFFLFFILLFNCHLKIGTALRSGSADFPPCKHGFQAGLNYRSRNQRLHNAASLL